MVATETASPDEALINLFIDQDAIEDPIPWYTLLRERAPRHHSATGIVVLTRFDDCNELLRNPSFGKGPRDGADDGMAIVPDTDPEMAEFRARQRERIAGEGGGTPSMLFLDPPDHTRQRKLVSRAFTPKRVEQMRATIGTLAEQCVDVFAEAGGGDLLDYVGFPLPVAVIGAMVGVPEEDWPRFRTLITTSAAAIEVGATIDDLKAAEKSNREVGEYFQALVAERRRNPQDDLLSDLIRVEEAGDQLSEGEVIAVSTLLFAAGFETTTNLIGNGMGALLRNPDEMARIWDDESLLPSAVEEMLRWDSPVQFDIRQALEDTTLFGEPVKRRQRVVTLLGAANRDPQHFTDPDRFDAARDEGPPMSFAAGIHYCLGANLSRAEGIEVFGALRRRFSSIELDGDLRRRRRMTLRGYESVPVSVTTR